MKKFSFLLVIVLLLGMVAGCTSAAPEQEEVLEPINVTIAGLKGPHQLV